MTIDAAICKLELLSKLTSSKEACAMGIEALKKQKEEQDRASLAAVVPAWLRVAARQDRER